MSDWAINRQFRSTEAARLRNRQEQRLSKINIKKGPEAEYRFNIDQINREQREIEKDLERIRLGVHKSPASSTLLGPEKKFHHPDFHIFGQKNFDKHGKEHNETGKHNTYTQQERENTELKHHGKEHDSKTHGKETHEFKHHGKEHKHDVRHNGKENHDLRYHGKDNHEFKHQGKENSELRNQRDYDFGLLDMDTGLNDTTEGEEDIDTYTIIEYLEKLKSGLNTDKTGRGLINQQNSSDIKHIQSKTFNNIIDQATSPQVEQTNIHQDTSCSTGNETVISNGPIGEGSHSLNDPSVGVDVTQTLLDLGAQSDTDMTSLRADITQRRSLSSNALQKVPSDDNFRRKKSVTLSNDSTSKPSDVTSDNKKGKISEEIPKRQNSDPDVLNPDRTDKTMHKLPPFEKAWAEAQKARYIRTKEPLERDRELSTHEIFDKSTK